MTQLSIKFKQRGKDLQGRIELPADHLFTLECLREVIVNLSRQSHVPVDEICQDLYAIVMTHTKTKDSNDPH